MAELLIMCRPCWHITQFFLIEHRVLVCWYVGYYEWSRLLTLSMPVRLCKESSFSTRRADIVAVWQSCQMRCHDWLDIESSPSSVYLRRLKTFARRSWQTQSGKIPQGIYCYIRGISNFLDYFLRGVALITTQPIGKPCGLANKMNHLLLNFSLRASLSAWYFIWLCMKTHGLKSRGPRNDGNLASSDRWTPCQYERIVRWNWEFGEIHHPEKFPKLQKYRGVASRKGRDGSHRLLRVFGKWKVVAKTV